MAVSPHSIAQRLLPRVGAGENIQLAPAVVVKPLNTPLAGRFPVLEDLGWLGHASVLAMRCFCCSATGRPFRALRIASKSNDLA